MVDPFYHQISIVSKVQMITNWFKISSIHNQLYDADHGRRCHRTTRRDIGQNAKGKTFGSTQMPPTCAATTANFASGFVSMGLLVKSVVQGHKAPHVWTS